VIQAHDIVAEFAAPSPVPIVLTFTRSSNLSPGNPWPSVGIDIGNDGTIEVPNLVSGMLASVVAGPQPVQVRILFGTQAITSGGSWAGVEIEARPDNTLNIVRNSLGCSSPWMFVNPVFEGRGVLVYGDPGVAVIGLSTQPALLQPAPFPAIIPWPCLLMPSPDIVLWAPSALHIPLPASLRPLVFHVQKVYVSQSDGLWTTDGYSIDAQ
jgi:hypothetical protein